MKTNYTEIDEIIYKYERYTKEIAKWLTHSKVQHSISTASYASYIAKKIEKPHLEHKVVIAGLLHDLCRELPPYEMLRRAEELDIPIDDFAKHNPILLHGPLSAEVAKQIFTELDEEIYEAIYWHTTGKAGLKLTGLILYLADFSEPLRKYAQAEVARDILDTQGFQKALIYTVEQRISLKKHPALPQTVEFLTWLKKEALLS